MPRKEEEFDFQIFVDPSCLSEPMDDQTTTTNQLPAEAAPEIVDIPVAADPTEYAEHSDLHGISDMLDNSALEPKIPETTDEPSEEQSPEEVNNGATDEPEFDATHLDSAEPEDAKLQDASVIDEESFLEGDSAIEEPPSDGHADDVEDEDGAAAGDQSVLESEHSITEEDGAEGEIHNNMDEKANDRSFVEEEQQDTGDDSFIGEDAETPKALRNHQSFVDDDVEFRPTGSTTTDRKASLRTEALIQAAARAVVAKLEGRSSNRDSTSQADEDADTSLLSTDSHDNYGTEDRRASYKDSPSHSRRESADSQIHHDIPSRSVSGDEGGDSSSHHEAEDDVFSDRSARSSIGSFDGQGDGVAKPQASNDQANQSFISHGRSPRISGVSIISGLSQYDKEDFVPTSRETRLPFRTPSDIRAMQMTSPTPSVFNGASPRSGKRHTGQSIGSAPRNSHFHSPAASAQYSPKGRSTPTRLKPRKTAPLVLLHVTLLPLRWMWGDVLDGLDPVNGKACDENKQVFEASEQLKTLRDAWRELQDCVGDTVLERGVLLPHPQNDFEVLEERFLEALELPLRRRARILECGHYLGPSNMTDSEDEESDDGYTSESTRTRENRKHWCNTCKGEIKYEALGPGKVFRVKVYASNGLMKAGAWEACWKDMERVDIEVEPIVEPAIQAELERLAEIQMRLEEERQQEAEAAAEEELRREEEFEHERVKGDVRGEEPIPDQTLPITSEPETSWAEPQNVEPERQSQDAIISSRPPSSMQIAMHASPAQPPYSSAMRAESPALMSVTHSRSMRSEPMDTPEERMRRDEERMREIYGDIPTPQPYSEMGSSVHAEQGSTRARHPDSYVPPQSPRSPSVEAYERRQQREAQRQSLDNASFTDLFFEAFKVLLRDPKNVAIIVLCLFLTCLMIRPTPQTPAFGHDQLAYRYEAKQDAVMHAPVAKMETQARSELGGLAASQSTEAALGKTLVESVSNVIMETSAASAGLVAPMASMLLEAPLSSEVPEVILQDLLIEAPEADLDTLPSEIASANNFEVDVPVLEEPATINLSGEPDSATATEEDVNLYVATIDTVPNELITEQAFVEASDIPTMEEAAVLNADVPDIPESHVEVEPESVGEVEAIPTMAAEPVELASDESPTAEQKTIDVPEEAPSTSEAPLETETPFDAASLVETEALPSSASVVESTVTTEADVPDPTHPCESYMQSFIAADALTTHRVFPVTQKTTIRVFETITETVRVSVTATETALFVETAVPQTVEETVYETETLRVTVSIPVDSATARDEL